METIQKTEKIFRKVDANVRQPEPHNKLWTKSVFVQSDNGIGIGYYDIEDKIWRIHHNDIATTAIYWLEEIEVPFSIP